VTSLQFLLWQAIVEPGRISIRPFFLFIICEWYPIKHFIANSCISTSSFSRLPVPDRKVSTIGDCLQV